MGSPSSGEAAISPKAEFTIRQSEAQSKMTAGGGKAGRPLVAIHLTARRMTSRHLRSSPAPNLPVKTDSILPKPACKPSAPAAPTLRQLLAAAPELGSAAGAGHAMDAWLRHVGRSAAGKALKQRLAKAAIARRLLEGISEGSPFLWQLATKDPARLLRVLDCEPEAYFAGLLAEAAAGVAAAKDEVQVMQRLRRLKAEAALLIALADIGGVWPVLRVTRALTELADTAIGAAVRFLLRVAAREGRLTP